MAKTPSKNGHASAKAAERPPTAYFLSLEVENVRCFGKKQKLDLSDGKGKPAPWTIILGVNGTGKTTLLQILAGFELILNVDEEGDDDLVPCFDHWDDSHRRFGIEDAHTEYTAIYCETSSVSSVPSEQYKIITRFIKSDIVEIDWPLPPAFEFPLLCAYGAGRRVGTVAFTENSTNDFPSATLTTDLAELRSPEEWLISLDYTAAKKSRYQDLQTKRRIQALELLKQVLWEITDIRFIPGEGVRPKPRVEFKTPYGWVPFRQLGYGYQSLATWVADFASRMVERYPESKNPLAEPAVVLVDEIDLHLHPKWQRELMDRLTNLFPNTQFIATAHSPLVVQAAANANLAVLRREGDHVVIDNDVDYIRNWRVDQILTSDLFGLESARPPHIEEKLKNREKILAKSKLTKADEQELKRLEADIGELPVGETKQQRQEMDRITKALDRLLEKEGLKLE